MKKDFKTNAVYRHFKGKYYYVHNVALDSETQKPFVVYQAMYEPFGFFIRSLEMFTEDIYVSREDNVTGQKERFKLCEESELGDSRQRAEGDN